MNGGTAQLVTLGSRIQRHREVTGLSQKALGDMVGLSRSSIAQIEAGKRKVDVLLLRELARQLGVDAMQLLGEEEEAGDSDSADTAIAQEVFDGGRVGNESLADFLATLRNYRQLLASTERPRPALPEPSDGISTRTPKYRIAAEAIRVREAMGLGDSPCGDSLRALIEGSGVPVFTLDLDPEDVSGLYVNYPGVGPVLMVNGRQLRWRQNFTLAHEFGHVWLHRSERAIASRIFSPPEATREIEGQANAFAAEFLMPEKTIKRALASLVDSEQITAEDVVHLQRMMGVSYKAMLIRLKALRLIGRKRFEELAAKRPVSVAFRLGYEVHPTEVGDEFEIPLEERFAREYLLLVIEAWNSGRLGEARAAEMLRTDILSLNEFMNRQAEEAALQQSEVVPESIGG